jgi:hypothetical protein
VPAPLRHQLAGHATATAHELGWATLANGEFIRAAEGAGYEVLITTDTNLKYQQNLSARRIAIVVLTTTSWPRMRLAIELIQSAVAKAAAGTYAEARIP